MIDRSRLGPGIYVHIPFCARKCYYCDFTAYVSRTGRRIAQYLDGICQEIQLYGQEPAVQASRFRTIYLGGGTPSILTITQIQRLMAELRRNFPLVTGVEITLEANPEDLSDEKLSGWRAAGINRLSIGAQASQDELLVAIGRNHDWMGVVAGYQRARSHGFDNVNIDLMFGLPGQTLEQWRETLLRITELKPIPPDHISCYGLQVEERTTFHRWLHEGRIQLPGDELEREMFELAREILTAAGYDHYEIANFARPGFRSKHNLNYWANGPYIGLGAGAWSYWQGARYGNETCLTTYGKLVRSGIKPIAECDRIDRRTQMAEAIILGTRLIGGMPISWFIESFGERPEAVFASQLTACAAQGWLEITPERIRLTDEGLLLANNVWQALL